MDARHIIFQLEFIFVLQVWHSGHVPVGIRFFEFVCFTTPVEHFIRASVNVFKYLRRQRFLGGPPWSTNEVLSGRTNNIHPAAAAAVVEKKESMKSRRRRPHHERERLLKGDRIRGVGRGSQRTGRWIFHVPFCGATFARLLM